MAGRNRSAVKIQIRMFGEFSITINKKTLTNFKGTTKRVWILIQYLLAHRFSAVPIDAIVSDLWKSKSCSDPKNALKNLVYRARALLKQLAGNGMYEFILFENGTYRWNNRYSCEIDTEQFLDLYRKGEDLSRDDRGRIESYKAAILLYSGTFLQKTTSESWAILMASQYADIYQKCVEKCCGVLFGLHYFQQAAEICAIALERLPYELSLHRLLLQSYVKAGMRSEAFQHYHYVRDLFFREFGIDISPSMLPFYQQLMNDSDHVETDLSFIKKDLCENSAEGAYYCDYDVFRVIYRIQARSVSRTGCSVFLALFTLTDRDCAFSGARIPNAVSEKLRDVILQNLRKSDVVTSYSCVQYLAMLPSTTFEDAQSIVERISRKYKFCCRKGNIELTATLSPLS